MKIQVLTGVLGIVLLTGLVPFPSAQAAAFIVDDFTEDPTAPAFGAGVCDISLTSGSVGPLTDAVTGTTAGTNGVVGGVRECSLTIDVAAPGGGSQGEIIVVGAPNDGPAPTPAMFRHMAGTGVETTATLAYDAGGAGLGVNLSTSENLKLVYSTSDFNVDVTARITDSDGDWAEQTGLLAAGTSGTATTILWAIQDFINSPSAIDGGDPNDLNLNDIDRIQIEFDTQVAVTDYDIDLIQVTTRVGGEFLGVDSTALLLAGLELNALYILPAIAAIGMGAFVVLRKQTQS